MKKIFLAIPCFTIFNIAVAQTKISIRAGSNTSTAKIIEDSVKQKTSWVNGFNAGLYLDFPFEGVLHFSPSITFRRRGYSFTHSKGMIKKTENRINYVDIMPALNLDFTKQSGSGFILGFSPVLSTAITGTEKNTSLNGSVTSRQMVFDFTNYSRIDAGLTGSIGYKFNKKIILDAAYYFGLANVENDETLLRNIQNRMVSVTLGYYIK